MSSSTEKPDLTALNDAYEIVGEIGGRDHTTSYVATRKEDHRDVLITVMRVAGDVSDGKAIAQFAADAKLLAKLRHPHVPQVIEGRWISDHSFALISNRVQGTTLAELLKGERLSNPRVADILCDVDGVLRWARGERIAHRGVIPEGVWIERGTGRVFVTLSPMEASRTNQPDDHDDARTIGTLAIAMLTAKPADVDHDGVLANMRPDLPVRVIHATERIAAGATDDEHPNIAVYLAGLAMADAIKEGELEVTRVGDEFRSAMKSEREAWEAEQEAARVAAVAQAEKFAEERAEYERRTAKEREQLASVRAEIDARRVEVQQARTELDQARAAFKQKKSELNTRAKEIDRHARDIEKKEKELFAATALNTATQEISIDGLKARLTAAPVPPPPIAGGIESVDDVPEPWMPIEETTPWTVPLETAEPASAMVYEAAALPEPEPAEPINWRRPAIFAGVGAVLIALALVINRPGSEPTLLASGPSAARIMTPDTAAMPATAPITDSAAGTIAPPMVGDSQAFVEIRDSILRSDARREARRAQAAAEEAAARATTYVDSNGVKWSTVPPPPLDSVQRAIDAAAKRDAAAKSAKKDSLKKDTTRVRPDTGRSPPKLYP